MGYETFYLDQRLGSVCTINGKDAYSLFNADLKELTPVSGSATADFSKALSAGGWNVISYKLSTGGIKLIFYVGGANEERSQINVSHLIAECQTCIIKTDEDRFEYVAILTGYDVIKTGVGFFREVSLTFSAIKRFPLVTHTFDGTAVKFYNEGSLTCGAKLMITANSAVEKFTIGNITISNLEANLPFVIDGLIGEVKCNGINRFLDTNLIDFPKVQPGSNTISASSLDVKIEVSYYPIFVV